jgi:hypothetical protein
VNRPRLTWVAAIPPTASTSWIAQGVANLRALPYLPIWPGLAIDSAFWGAVAFGVVTGVRSARQHAGSASFRAIALCKAIGLDRENGG